MVFGNCPKANAVVGFAAYADMESPVMAIVRITILKMDFMIISL